MRRSDSLLKSRRKSKDEGSKKGHGGHDHSAPGHSHGHGSKDPDHGLLVRKASMKSKDQSVIKLTQLSSYEEFTMPKETRVG